MRVVDFEADGATALFALLYAGGEPLPRRVVALAHGRMIAARTDDETRAAWGRPLGHSRACGAIVDEAETLALAPDNDLTRSMLAALDGCPTILAEARRALAGGREDDARLRRAGHR